MAETMTIQEWAARCIEASYPLAVRWELAQTVDAYLEWLASL